MEKWMPSATFPYFIGSLIHPVNALFNKLRVRVFKERARMTKVLLGFYLACLGEKVPPSYSSICYSPYPLPALAPTPNDPSGSAFDPTSFPLLSPLLVQSLI